MSKYRVQFKINETVEADDSERAIKKAIRKALAFDWEYYEDVVNYIYSNADVYKIEDEGADEDS